MPAHATTTTTENEDGDRDRDSVYSFSSRPKNPFYPELSDKAYGSFTASPHSAPQASCSSALRSAQAPPSQHSLSDDMIAKFSESFQRRSVSHTSLHPSSPALISPSEAQSVSPSPPQDVNALFYHRQSRINFWYPMSSSKYTAVLAHRFQARRTVLLQPAVHVSRFPSPETVKKGPATAPLHC